jgi:hypothetical protein
MLCFFTKSNILDEIRKRMNKNNFKYIVMLIISIFLFAGCAPKIPMADMQKDLTAKKFSKPKKNRSGIYIYRNTFSGSALIKSLMLDDKALGPISNKTYRFKEVSPGKHKLSTTSEFSPNYIFIQAQGGKNYYFNHYIKMGVFIGGANLEAVSEEKGKKNILKCKLAK